MSDSDCKQATGRISGYHLRYLVSLMALFSISACSDNSVSLKKIPIEVKTSYFDMEERDKVPLEEGEDALTLWQFGCKTDFEFDITDKTMLNQKDYMVTLKIRRASLTLSVPITVLLPKDAPDELIKHEDGHVAICKRIYAQADSDALAAGRSVIGREYQASGPSLEAACRTAIERASEDIYMRYHARASLAVNRISDIYDDLDRADHEKADVTLEKAFAKYRKELGSEKQAASDVSLKPKSTRRRVLH